MFTFVDSARCPDSTDVILGTSCHRSHNETCSYTCKQGYQPTNSSDGNYVTCTTSSAWDRPLSLLCEKLKCPTTIPHGTISKFCSREYNSWCDYYNCDSGYVKPSNYQTLVCNASGHWNWWLLGSSGDFCVSENDLCPGQIKNGRLKTPCGRTEGDRCSFSCDDGCKTNSDIYKLTCHNKTWDADTDTLCTDCLQCNHTFPRGSVGMQNCYAGQQCSYVCTNDMRYAKNENITSITCSNMTNTWVSSDQSFTSTAEDEFCLPRRCSSNIPNGHFLSSCTAEVGSFCRYKCDADFIGNVSEIYCGSKSSFTFGNEVITYWSVKDMRQLCTNSKQCPLESIPGGSLDQACTRNPGDVCSYTCDYGYRPTHRQYNQTTITCNSSSMWNATLSHLCKRITCPSTIPNGYVNCYRRSYDQRCYDISCNAGYQPSQDYPSLKCNYDGEWEWTIPSSLKFCLSEDELCPSTIPGGHLSYDCRRHEGSSCSYYCNGCKTYSAPYYLHCRNKTWDADTRYLCTECTTTTTVAPVRCPSYIPGGDISYICDRTPGTWCSYYCDSGCTKQYVSLLCNSHGEWQSGDWACTCPKCPYYIPNGYISSFSYDLSTCDYKPGSTCDVKCNVWCNVGYSTAYCLSTGKWSLADSLCNCKESAFSDKDTSDGGSTSTVAVVLSVVGVIAFFAIVAGVITKFRRQCSQPTSQSASTSQSSTQHDPYTITTATNNTHGINVNNSQGTQDGAQTYFNTTYIQEPPPYSELSFPKEDESTPTTPPPPSYEEVTSHPLEHMTQQTTNSTQQINNSNSVNGNDSTPL